ncbi:hypothetical protein [Sporomusa acidovorans]|uniref:Uncharacterized protein n=1 Tax=Sporomusa acidovorans (strain ATCC 49682 / DSM 3132 / Mol) TaxID=1123286 RepID=A0ABZ3J980_SPOA4|nr:hypothetical protein [Sporomusa acidovorans]OZC22957.1 hypothetical protein SPACI_10300 [Sporomusa acidovorans DSM 3132]SDE93981.1 hypothetical protein SAMN04488499_102723 [Sporomusa acidovorans]
MHILKTMADLRNLLQTSKIHPLLVRHLAWKLKRLQAAVAPDGDFNTFSLEAYGVFGILEAGDKDLAALDRTVSVETMRPDWMHCLHLSGDSYYVCYFLTVSGYMDQLYVANHLTSKSLRLRLAAEAVRTERSGEDDPAFYQPF